MLCTAGAYTLRMRSTKARRANPSSSAGRAARRGPGGGASIACPSGASSTSWPTCTTGRHGPGTSGRSPARSPSSTTPSALPADHVGLRLQPGPRASCAAHARLGHSAHALVRVPPARQRRSAGAALRDLINACHRCDLPKVWGTGTSAAPDGTKYDLAENSLPPSTRSDTAATAASPTTTSPTGTIVGPVDRRLPDDRRRDVATSARRSPSPGRPGSGHRTGSRAPAAGSPPPRRCPGRAPSPWPCWSPCPWPGWPRWPRRSASPGR